MLIHGAALYLQRVGNLAGLEGEGLGKDGEALHLFIMGEVLLQRLYALPQHLAHGLQLAELIARSEGKALLLGVFFQQLVGRHDEGADEFALVGNDDGLLDVAVYGELAFYHLRGDVFAVGRLEEVLDALRHVEFAVLDIAGVAGVEPTVGLQHLGRLFGFAVVAGGDGSAAHENLVVLSDFHLHARHHAADGAHRHVLVLVVETYRGGGLRQAVAHANVEAGGVDEAFHFGAHGGTGGGEACAALYADGFAQEGDDGLVVEGSLELEGEGRGDMLGFVVLPVVSAHLDGVKDEAALHLAALFGLVEYGLVNFFPEARHGGHAGGVYLLHTALYVLRLEVYAECAAPCEAEIRPSALEDVGEGQEVEDRGGFRCRSL